MRLTINVFILSIGLLCVSISNICNQKHNKKENERLYAKIAELDSKINETSNCINRSMSGKFSSVTNLIELNTELINIRYSTSTNFTEQRISIATNELNGKIMSLLIYEEKPPAYNMPIHYNPNFFKNDNPNNQVQSTKPEINSFSTISLK